MQLPFAGTSNIFVEEISALFREANPGKPHIANLMVKDGYAKSINDAFHRFLDQLSSPGMYIRPEQAIEAIMLSGGIPVLAHPTYGSGDELIIGEEMDERLRRLIGFGLQGVEAFYSGFTPKLQGEVLNLAEKYGLYVTAGSDYHGKNKLVLLGSSHMDDVREGPEGLKRFLSAVNISAVSYQLIVGNQRRGPVAGPRFLFACRQVPALDTRFPAVLSDRHFLTPRLPVTRYLKPKTCI